MIIACICGGVVEGCLLCTFLAWLFRKIKHKHNCKCECHKEEKKVEPLANSRSLTCDEKASVNEFFWSHFKNKDGYNPPPNFDVERPKPTPPPPKGQK